MDRRTDLGTIVAAAGGLLLLISLFVEWYSLLTAWDAFEILDLLLVGLAVVLLLVSAGRIGLVGFSVPERLVAALGIFTVFVVLVQVFNQPPAAQGRDLEAGIWLALAGAVLMAAGAIMSAANVSLSVRVAPAERDEGEAAPPAAETPRPRRRRTSSPPPP